MFGFQVLLYLQGDRYQWFGFPGQKQAEYWFLRRIEKEGWRAGEGYIVEEKDALPLDRWEEKAKREIFKAEIEAREEHEKAEYQRLKKKYEK